ncbi:MAG: fused DSP-PTPase phosphatase/NAD kinase-like protein [Phycisphaerae bacterium]
MIGFLRKHGLSVLVAGVMVGAAWGSYQRWFFVDRFGVVAAGELYRCRQPRGKDWWLLERYNIRRVINLRPAAENPQDFAAELRACSAAGARLLHIPMPDPTPTRAQLRRFLRVVSRSEGPVLVHCEHGRDRAGVMVACYRIVEQGWTLRKAADEMLRYKGRPVSPPEWSRRMEFLREVYTDSLTGELRSSNDPPKPL